MITIRRKNIPATKGYRKRQQEMLEAKNPHINFEREEKKSNARKWATDVICTECGKKFTLPFKPRKPEVYCDECFKKTKKSKGGRLPAREAMRAKTDPEKSGSFREFVSKTAGRNKEKKSGRRKRIFR